MYRRVHNGITKHMQFIVLGETISKHMHTVWFKLFIFCISVVKGIELHINTPIHSLESDCQVHVKLYRRSNVICTPTIMSQSLYDMHLECSDTY